MAHATTKALIAAVELIRDGPLGLCNKLKGIKRK